MIKKLLSLGSLMGISSLKVVAMFIMLLIAHESVSQVKTMSIKCELQKNGKITNDSFVIKIICNDNIEAEFNATGYFSCDLELEKEYMVVMYAENCQPKYITIDTRNGVKKIFKYHFSINLITSYEEKPIYAGGIFYDDFGCVKFNLYD